MTPVIVVPPEVGVSSEKNASKSSFPVAVENDGVLIVVPPPLLSVEVVMSIASWPGGSGAITFSVAFTECVNVPAVAVIPRV